MNVHNLTFILALLSESVLWVQLHTACFHILGALAGSVAHLSYFPCR